MVLRQATDPDLACLLLQVCSEDEAAAGGVGACYECRSVAHFIQQQLYDYESEKRIQVSFQQSLLLLLLPCCHD